MLHLQNPKPPRTSRTRNAHAHPCSGNTASPPVPDVLASAANYLSSVGWNQDQTWGREVITINAIDDNEITTSARKVEISKKLSDWAGLGVRNLDGTALPDVNINAYLVYPEGAQGRKFIVYENFKTILHWNRSLFFGIAVGRLSDLIEYY